MTGEGRNKLHAQGLRERAKLCRIVASVPTNGGHETDLILLDLAERLEDEAARLEAREP